MSNEVALLGATLVAAGIYITYLHLLVSRYRRTLTLATFALEAAFDDIFKERSDGSDKP